MSKKRNQYIAQQASGQAAHRSVTAAPRFTGLVNLNRLTLTAALGVNPLPSPTNVESLLRLGRDSGGLVLPAWSGQSLRATWDAKGSCQWHTTVEPFEQRHANSGQRA